MKHPESIDAGRRVPSLMSALAAILVREMRAALINRYVQVCSALALAGGIAAVSLVESSTATAFSLAQIALYFVSLFALLAGVSSARAEAEEWLILFSQPSPRWTCVIGKFLALWAIFAVVLALLFLPSLLSGDSSAVLARLYGQTLGLAAIFGALGLSIGFLAGDRVPALILSVTAWLVLLFGVDLVALFAAQWPVLQKWPNAWVAFLMSNPLDAFRIQMLFALEQVPPEAAGKTPLAAWWISHAGLWFGITAVVWPAVLLTIASCRLQRCEL